MIADETMEAGNGPTAADPGALVAEIAGHLNVQNGRLVSVMSDVMSNGEWVGTGIHSPTQWLAWKAGISPERAHVITRVAEKRAEFPVVTS